MKVDNATFMFTVSICLLSTEHWIGGGLLLLCFFIAAVTE